MGATSSFLPIRTAKALKLQIKDNKHAIPVKVANSPTSSIDKYAVVKINIGFGDIAWRFFVGDIKTPFIGHDLLAKFDLLVRPSKHTILHPNTHKFSKFSRGKPNKLSSDDSPGHQSRPSQLREPVIEEINRHKPTDHSNPVLISQNVDTEWDPIKGHPLVFIETNSRPFTQNAAPNVKHSIITTGPPCTSRPRRLHPDKLTQLYKCLAEMGVLVPSSSPWSSPLHLPACLDMNILLGIEIDS